MKKLILATALFGAVMTSAHAAKIGFIGNTIVFSQYNNGRSVVGCTDPTDARQARKLWNDEYELLRFVSWVRKLDDDKRVCVVLSDNPKHGWKIIDKQAGTSTNAWFCLESTIDYSDRTKPAEQSAPYCFWVWMLDK
jgi:hypothetical protein